MCKIYGCQIHFPIRDEHLFVLMRDICPCNASIVCLFLFKQKKKEKEILIYFLADMDRYHYYHAQIFLQRLHNVHIMA